MQEFECLRDRLCWHLDQADAVIGTLRAEAAHATTMWATAQADCWQAQKDRDQWMRRAQSAEARLAPFERAQGANGRFVGKEKAA